jgi:hypothetical protein
MHDERPRFAASPQAVASRCMELGMDFYAQFPRLPLLCGYSLA